MPHQQVAHPQYMAAAAAAHQRGMPPVNDAHLRRSRKPTEKNMPDGIEDYVIGNGVQEYKRLQNIEKRLDSSMVRKRLDIQDSLGRSIKRYKTLRIWISNTTDGQDWQQGEQNGNGEGPGAGRYKVRIEGRILDDGSADVTVPAEDSDSEAEEEEAAGDKEGADAEKPKSKKQQERPRQKLSHFFKSITVDFDRTNSVKEADLSPIIWTKPQIPPTAVSQPPSADFDEITFSRAAQENVNFTLTLVRDEQPERLKLSPELQDVIDMEEATRSEIISALWDYAQVKGLQEDHEKRLIRCDAKLRNVTIPNSLHSTFNLLTA